MKRKKMEVYIGRLRLKVHVISLREVFGFGPILSCYDHWFMCTRGDDGIG